MDREGFREALLGVMERNGRQYNAWAVETRLPGGTVFALYLEHVVLTSA